MGDHDKLFKRVFGVPAHAAGELRSVLPPAVIESLDLDALELDETSFVDAEMRDRHSDLLFRVPIAGKTAYLYCLFEHQSQPDPLMPWRMSEYVHRIWERAMRAEPERTTLPLIIPVVVHHGAGGWAASRRLHQLVDGLDELSGVAPLVPDLELLIDDIASASDDDLQHRPLLPLPKVALWLLRDLRDLESLFAHIEAWATLLAHLGQADMLLVMRYIVRVTNRGTLDEMLERIARVTPAAESSMSSAAKSVYEEALERGLQQGQTRALRKALLRQLTARFGAVAPDVGRRIERAELAELETWVGRFATAERLDDVFVDTAS
jgi:predicted transposase/invertase (TIGR01784 family)